ncbi:MAG: HAD family phosphatase [Bacteroidales bacterium]|nr:HAD family phosphatase [Bacteroidales bacterium]
MLSGYKYALSKYKNIIFDFGGVIIDIDYQLTYNAFKKAGINDFNLLFSRVKQTELFDDFEKGLISPNEFRKNIKTICNINISNEEFDFAWNSLLVGIPKERILLLEKLRKNYRIFLLSNTNKIHYDCFIDELRKNFGYNKFSDIFEKDYFSFKLAIKKPDLKIFEMVLSQNCLKPSETLFIDDTPIHIEAAKNLGVDCCLLNNNHNITDILK